MGLRPEVQNIYFVLTKTEEKTEGREDRVLNILLLGRGCSCAGRAGSCNQTELLKIIKINELQQQQQ